MATSELKLDRFTNRAVRVVGLANDEAVKRRHELISPEHILFALTIVERGPGRIALERLGLDLAENAQIVEGLIQAESPSPVDAKPNADPETMGLLEHARSEARSLKHWYVGTEHLVLGLLHCNSCPAKSYLMEHGVTLESLRDEVLKVLRNE